MTCWAVIPVKPPEACKTRLGGVLSDPDRRRLVARMLGHVVETARSVPGVDQTLILGPSRHGLSADIPLLADPGRGLDAALASAVGAAARADVDRIVFLSADLPRVTADDIARLCRVAPGEVAVAPDRRGTGTNALTLPAAHARDFRFGYGPGSFARHAAEAGRLALRLIEIGSPTLALDIDLPEDLALIADIMRDREG